MRILLITDTSGHMRGGVPAEMRQLIQGLAARGHAVALCGDVVVPDCEVVAHFAITIPVDGSLVRQSERALREFSPDIVHVVSMSSRGILMLKKVLDGTPWVMTCHSLPPHERKLAGLHGHEAAHYAARAVRFFPNAAAWFWVLHTGTVPHVIVHSDWMRSLVTAYGQSDRTTSSILLGCQIKTSLPIAETWASSEARLLTIAGLAHTKGHHDAIKAVAIVRKRFPGISYQIVGELRDASYLRYLRSLIATLDLNSTVQITLDLPEDQKQHALRSADLYLQPSHEEGFCLAYIEAAQCVPRLVGTDTGAIRRMSEDDPGAVVVPPRRPTDMAAAIATLLERPLAADLMSKRAVRLDAHFAWSLYLDAHLALYQSLRLPSS